RIAAVARRIPRTNPLIDMGLDWIRQDPAPSEAVLEGLFLGSSAPHHQFRAEMNQPALVIGHRADPLHPFSDSGMLAEELQNARLIEANSILEWRLSPKRLDDELARFLDEVWEGQTDAAVTKVAAGSAPPRPDGRESGPPASSPVMSSRREEKERLRQQRLAAERAAASTGRRRIIAGYAVAGALGLAVLVGLVVV